MSLKELVAGGVITLVIGGTAYKVNEADVAKNFANDTGLTQQEAEEYVGNVKEDDLVSYDEVGATYVDSGQQLLASANEIDCPNYEYEWESETLSCNVGKAHLIKVSNDEIALGKSFKILQSDTASRQDISSTIQLIDTVNIDYKHEIIPKMLGQSSIDEALKNNSYNKALLKTALESN